MKLMLIIIGDDPLTGGAVITALNAQQYNTIQQIQCKANLGYFTLSYQQKTTAYIAWDANSYEIVSKLEALPNLGPNSIKLVFYTQATPQACTASGI